MLFHYIGADIFHLLAVVVLLARILKRKSCADISGKCQLLLAVSFTIKSLYTFASDSYTFLFYHFASKLFFITFSYVLVLLVFFAFRSTRQADKDAFPTEFLVVPAFVLALFFNIELTPLDVTWEFGTYLEALAMLPQFHAIYRDRRLDKNMFAYLLALVFYKLFYNFTLISLYCQHKVQPDVSLGVMQMALEGVVSIGAFVVLLCRGVDLFREERDIAKGSFLLGRRGCPYSETCKTPKRCGMVADSVVYSLQGRR